MNIVESFGLKSIPLLLIQKWFRKMRAYMYAYEHGATGATADVAVKERKSHRLHTAKRVLNRPTLDLNSLLNPENPGSADLSIRMLLNLEEGLFEEGTARGE